MADFSVRTGIGVQLKRTFAALGLMMAGVVSPAIADAETPTGNFELRIAGRHDFHTWLWAVSNCPGECVRIQAIPQPIAKAFAYRGVAQLANGRYTMTVDIPDGLRCGDVYFGPTIPTRDVYSWDAATRSGTLESSFDGGCDGAPGTLSYPFTLARL